MPKTRLKFMWDWQVSWPLWPADQEAVSRLGVGPIDPATLGLPTSLIEKFDRLSAWHDTALNWSYPPGPGPWRQEECERFNSASKSAFEKAATLLHDHFEVAYAHREEREDPDLDSYLADPTQFRRKA